MVNTVMYQIQAGSWCSTRGYLLSKLTTISVTNYFFSEVGNETTPSGAGIEKLLVSLIFLVLLQSWALPT